MNKLKQLLKLDPNKLTKIDENHLFNELKNSSLLVAIDENSNPLKLNYDNKSFIPIFTDEIELNNFGAFSFIRYNTKNLIDLLSNENVDNIVINPASDNPFAMDLNYFISNCNNKFNMISIFTDIIKSGVKPLDDISVFYLREKVPFLNKNVKDDVFTSPIPICVSLSENFNNNYEYLNMIYVPKGTLIANTGQLAADFGDIILAPIIKLRQIEKNDNTFIWQCIEQDFNIY